MSDQNDLMSLKTQVDKPQSGRHSGNPDGQNMQPPREDKLPLLGLFAVGFAALGIFTFAPVFVPLGLILGIIALFIGQIGLGIGAIFLSIIAILTSPTIMAAVGLGAFLAWLGL